jgi:hypothetical protein
MGKNEKRTIKILKYEQKIRKGRDIGENPK